MSQQWMQWMVQAVRMGRRPPALGTGPYPHSKVKARHSAYWEGKALCPCSRRSPAPLSWRPLGGKGAADALLDVLGAAFPERAMRGE
jgi:hypothetical protein